MSCIKSASTIFSDLDVEPKKKVQLTIAAARRFEKYISDGSPGETSHDPESRDRPYQDLEDDLDCRPSRTGRSKITTKKPHP